MKIVLDHIKEKPLELNGDKAVEYFPVLTEMQSAGECVFTSPISYTLTAAKEYDHIRVCGHVRTSLSLSCSRCLAMYESPLISYFTIVYRKATESAVVEEEETELSSDDLISSTYSGNEIDLAHDIEEQVAMSVPLKPLCSEDCKGFCQECGADLNHASCSCSDKAYNFKFSALKNFKVS